MTQTHGNSTRHRSHIGGSGLGSILASLLGGGVDMEGAKSLAKGPDAIISTVERLAKEKGADKLPKEYIDDLKEKLDDCDDAELFEMPDGSHVIAGTSVEMGFGDNMPGGLDLEGLRSALRHSDRHGGRSMLDELSDILGDRGGARGGLFEALRSRRKAADANPFRDFLASSVDTLSPKNDKPGRTAALDLSLAANITASELLRYPHHTDNGARKLAGAFAKLIDDYARTDAAKMKNLGSYLERYSVGLMGIADRLRQFEKSPRPEAADALATEMARVGMALVSVTRDAADKAERLAKDAKNI